MSGAPDSGLTLKENLVFGWVGKMLVQWLNRSDRDVATPPVDGRLDRAARRQVGALCWRRSGEKIEILLITSRESGRWIIPKGGRMAGLSNAAAAAEEAWEEAGVRGKLSERRVGTFHYAKRLERGGLRVTAVEVYALRVKQERDDWPERKERTRRWFSVAAAAAAVDEPELKTLIAGFEP